ncbi:hypothetical protein [Parachlamydia sp. AcF125]|uniref:hypothetical protein n=1 Tax=Parachlamydia sp. AcF125 TaxID=2795736 RepID=UPI001BC968EF|nr:hypothetical protein [Parachlamydia sp. AcF125]
MNEHTEFEFIADEEAFIKQFSDSMKRGDVPFFTKNKDFICFGHFSKENKIAKLKANNN